MRKGNEMTIFEIWDATVKTQQTFNNTYAKVCENYKPFNVETLFVEFPDGELNFYRRKSEIIYSEGSKDYIIESCKLAKLDSGNYGVIVILK